MTREVMSIVFEFILSVIILIGGGYMVFTGQGTELGVSAVTAVITFWFTRRQAEQLMKTNEPPQSKSGERNGK